jgi:hypothetical protein
MTDAAATGRKSPLNIEVRTGDPTGPTFQTPFIGHGNAVFFKSVHIGRTDIEARLIATLFHTYGALDNPKVWLFVHPKTIQEKFIFDIDRHFTLRHPLRARPRSLPNENRFRISRQMDFCLSFFGTPSTVSISRAAKLATCGRDVTSSGC